MFGHHQPPEGHRPATTPHRERRSGRSAANRPNAARARSRVRHWAPAIVTVAALAGAQLLDAGGAVDALPTDAITATTLAPHLRTVAVQIDELDRPSLAPGDRVDVHGIDGTTGSVRLLVEAALVTQIDQRRIVVAIDQRDATPLTSSIGLGRVHVVGR